MKLREHIQSKSSGIKSRYAFLSAFCATGIIALLWATTLPARFSDVPDTQVSTEKQEDFFNILEDAKNQLGAIVESTQNEGESIESNNLDALNAGTEESVDYDAFMPASSTVQNTSTTTTASGTNPTPRTVLIEVKQPEGSTSTTNNTNQ